MKSDQELITEMWSLLTKMQTEIEEQKERALLSSFSETTLLTIAKNEEIYKSLRNRFSEALGEFKCMKSKQ